jgi:hypothetical protein
MRAGSHTPSWYQHGAVLRSAVAYLAAASSKFDWVGIYTLHGDTLELGPYIGAPTEHTRITVGVGVCGTAVARNDDMNVPDVHASETTWPAASRPNRNWSCSFAIAGGWCSVKSISTATPALRSGRKRCSWSSRLRTNWGHSGPKKAIEQRRNHTDDRVGQQTEREDGGVPVPGSQAPDRRPMGGGGVRQDVPGLQPGDRCGDRARGGSRSRRCRSSGPGGAARVRRRPLGEDDRVAAWPSDVDAVRGGDSDGTRVARGARVPRDRLRCQLIARESTVR